MWARSALAQLADVPGAYRAGLALAEGGGRRLLFTASDRDGGSSVPWCEIDEAPGPAFGGLTQLWRSRPTRNLGA